MHEDVSSMMKSAETPRITAENHDVFNCSEYSRKRGGLNGKNAIVDKQGTTMLLENDKERRVKSDSESSITVIEQELSHRRAARGVAIVVVHRDRELLASAR